MRVSYNWLRELLPGFSPSPEAVAQHLTALGLEVEGRSEFGHTLDPLRIVAVVAREPHPERPRLNLVTVDTGGQTERVVCGASNVPEPGGLCVLAPLGTYLPAVDMKLEPREIGGVMSAGMLCSERELGLAEQSEGILVFPKGTAAPGTPFLSAFPEAKDVVFELSITPNRPDALGHLGVARDLSALLKATLTEPNPGLLPAPVPPEAAAVVIENQQPSRCPRYGAAVVGGITVGPSPDWLRWRLSRLGIRPISNVVDVTNLLLLEYGHPMHAFDLDRVAGRKIVIRRARDGEPFTTLDGVQRRLSDDDLMICDAERPIALAGIMGGENTEIGPATRNVLLECAYFTPGPIRRSSRRHALHSESSHRFERGVNWAAIRTVLSRAQGLLQRIAGASTIGPHQEVGSGLEGRTITLRHERLENLLGSRVPFREATDILRRLGFRISRINDGGASPTVIVETSPARPDVALEVDLIEEVARDHGYDRVPTRLPKIAPQAPRSSGKLERQTRTLASELGLSEVVGYAFIAPRDHQLLGLGGGEVTLQNPLTEERSVMRKSLLPGLFDALRRARRHGEPNLRLFSIGTVFDIPDGPEPSIAAAAARPRAAEDEGAIPRERPEFAALLTGTRRNHLERPEPIDVYDAKAIALAIVERLCGRTPSVESLLDAEAPGYLHPRATGAVAIDGRRLGHFGPLHPDLDGAFDLGGGAFAIELDLAAIEALGRATARFRPIPKLPAVTRDLALELRREIQAAEVERAISEAGGELCESVELFDLFEGGSVKDGYRSLAFHVVYRDPNAARNPEAARTLTDAEVDERHAQVVRAAKDRFGAVLRA